MKESQTSRKAEIIVVTCKHYHLASQVTFCFLSFLSFGRAGLHGCARAFLEMAGGGPFCSCVHGVFIALALLVVIARF